jgi:hypothetical protein
LPREILRMGPIFECRRNANLIAERCQSRDSFDSEPLYSLRKSRNSGTRPGIVQKVPGSSRTERLACSTTWAREQSLSCSRTPESDPGLPSPRKCQHHGDLLRPDGRRGHGEARCGTCDRAKPRLIAMMSRRGRLSKDQALPSSRRLESKESLSHLVMRYIDR